MKQKIINKVKKKEWNKNMKKVSIIIPMHNSSGHIDQCIDSVLNQTYKNIEVIVVDDKSSDNSIELVEQKKDSRIKLIKLSENLGAAKARNTGIDAATGEYICFLDSDDYWKLDKLEKQVNFIEKNNYTFIYGGYVFLKKDKTTHVAHVPESINYKQALKNTTIFTSTVMFNMTHLKKEDIYMPNVKRGQDTATWWQILKKGITAYGIDEVLAFYRVGEKSLSSNKFKALKRTWDLYKREDISFFKRVYCFICYIKNAIKRRI